MDSNKIKAILVAIFAIFIALYLGISAATAQMETIAWVLGGGTLVVCLFLGRRIWLLIPFLGSIELSLRLPGAPSTLLIAQLLVLGFSVLLMMMRKLPFRLHLTELEWWLVILTLMILQAYLRNPVGLNILGGGSVGGRPYAIFAVSILVALLLAGIRVPLTDVKLILKLSILGGLVNAGIAVVAHFFPLVGYWTGGTYLNEGEANYEDVGVAVDTGAANRIGSLTTITRNVAMWVASFVSPLKACFQPLWAPLVIFTVVGAAYSGFRSTVITVGVIYLIGIAYRGGITSLLIAGLGGMAGVVLLAVVNLIHPLPPNVQRGLSFIPGSWDDRYVRDATGSTDWRVEIWQEALLSDRWIKNKWLGDGLGFSAQELAYQMNISKGNQTGISGLDNHRETIMANGDYHSTIVSGIRTAGTLILLLATIRLAIHAHRLIRRHRRDEFYPVCLFLGIPLVAAPFHFMIGASNFAGVASSFILGIAMIRLLENNLPVPELMPAGTALPLQRGPFAPRNRSFPASNAAS